MSSFHHFSSVPTIYFTYVFTYIKYCTFSIVQSPKIFTCYPMAKQACHLCERSMHTLCTISEQLFQAIASTILELTSVIAASGQCRWVLILAFIDTRPGIFYVPGDGSPSIHGTDSESHILLCTNCP